MKLPGEIFCMRAFVQNEDNIDNYNPLSSKASAYPYIMYMHEAMQQDDESKIRRSHGKTHQFGSIVNVSH